MTGGKKRSTDMGPRVLRESQDPTQQESPSVNKSTPTHTYIHIYNMKYYSAMKKNEIILFAET